MVCNVSRPCTSRGSCGTRSRGDGRTACRSRRDTPAPGPGGRLRKGSRLDAGSTRLTMRAPTRTPASSSCARARAVSSMGRRSAFSTRTNAVTRGLIRRARNSRRRSRRSPQRHHDRVVLVVLIDAQHRPPRARQRADPRLHQLGHADEAQGVTGGRGVEHQEIEAGVLATDQRPDAVEQGHFLRGGHAGREVDLSVGLFQDRVTEQRLDAHLHFLDVTRGLLGRIHFQRVEVGQRPRRSPAQSADRGCRRS